MIIKPPSADYIHHLTAQRQGQKYLVALVESRHLLLQLCCEHDQIPLEEMARRPFSSTNPWVSKLNLANALLWKARGEYEAGGGYAAITIHALEGVTK